MGFFCSSAKAASSFKPRKVIHNYWDNIWRHYKTPSITFPRPTAPSPGPQPPAPWTFLWPSPQITFSRPPNAWTQVLRRFKSCSWRVRDSRWWESLTMAPAGNKAKGLSSVNHTTKTIHYHHHQHQFITISIKSYLFTAPSNNNSLSCLF